MQATRHARRVYVGGFPDSTNEPELGEFVGNALEAVRSSLVIWLFLVIFGYFWLFLVIFVRSIVLNHSMCVLSLTGWRNVAGVRSGE